MEKPKEYRDAELCPNHGDSCVLYVPNFSKVRVLILFSIKYMNVCVCVLWSKNEQITIFLGYFRFRLNG